MQTLNHFLFSYFYSFAHRSQFTDSVIVLLATDFGLITFFALIYFIWKHHDKKHAVRETVIVVGSAAIAWGIAHLIKAYYPMPRPDLVLQGVVPLFAPDDVQSFPSGHATFYSALAAGMYFHHKKVGEFLAVCALLIGVARVMAGVHFPFDILSGFVLGPAVASLAYIHISKMTRK